MISQDVYSYTQIINKWHIGVSMAYFYGLKCSNTSKIKVFTGVKGVYLVMLIMFIRWLLMNCKITCVMNEENPAKSRVSRFLADAESITWFHIDSCSFSVKWCINGVLLAPDGVKMAYFLEQWRMGRRMHWAGAVKKRMKSMKKTEKRDFVWVLWILS